MMGLLSRFWVKTLETIAIWASKREGGQKVSPETLRDRDKENKT